MSHRFTIAVDIGKTAGAIAIQENDEIKTYPMPKIGNELDLQKIYDILMPYEGGNGIAVFEKITPYVQNKSTAFSLGQQSGFIEMALVALSIPYVKILPAAWQKTMFKGVEEQTKSTGGRDTKAMALIACKRRFPKLKLTFGNTAEKPHDGLIDAVLMSEYAKSL